MAILRALIIGLAIGVALGANIKNVQLVFSKLVNHVSVFAENSSKNPNHELRHCLPEFDVEAFEAAGSSGIALIIGHAYGSHDTYGEGVDASLAEFLKVSEVAQATDRIYFTGDVLHTPSRARWSKIKSEFSMFKILIAPGNHDVGRGDNSNRDIFFDQFPSLPITEMHPEYLIVALDSTEGPESLTVENVDYLKRQISKHSDKKKVFVLVHHVLRSGGKGVANSAPSMSAQAKANRRYLEAFLAERQGSKTELTFISGDTGAWASSPRLDCVNQFGASFISSGIGGFESDGVLVIAQSEIYFLPLSTVEKSN